MIRYVTPPWIIYSGVFDAPFGLRAVFARRALLFTQRIFPISLLRCFGRSVTRLFGRRSSRLSARSMRCAVCIALFLAAKGVEWQAVINCNILLASKILGPAGKRRAERLARACAAGGRTATQLGAGEVGRKRVPSFTCRPGRAGVFSSRSFANQPLQSAGSERRAPRAGAKAAVVSTAAAARARRPEHRKNQLPPSHALLTVSLLSRKTYIALSQPT
jgi:hypothetical protein